MREFGRRGAPGHACPPISATPTPTCSAPSAPGRARAPLSCSPSPTPALCRCISTRSAATSAAKAHGVVLMDRAGWHSTGKLKVPKNLTIILLPSRSPRVEPGREHLAVPPPELALEPRLRRLPRHHRGRLPSLEQAHRSTRDDHVHRIERLGPHRSIINAVGMSTREASRVFGLDRKTVRKMLSFSVPPGYRRGKPPRRPKLGPFTGIIDRILEDDRTSHHKATAHGEADLRPSPGRVRVHRRLHHREGLCP